MIESFIENAGNIMKICPNGQTKRNVMLYANIY